MLKGYIISVQLKGHNNKKTSTQMIHAGVKELKQAFYAHRDVLQDKKCTSYYLLLFYATECGLKSIYLKQKNLWKTDKIQDKTLLSEDGHNLDRWVKELKISASQVERTPQFQLDRDDYRYTVERSHEVWRYGVRMKSKDEKDMVKWLERVCAWIEDNIKR